MKRRAAAISLQQCCPGTSLWFLPSYVKLNLEAETVKAMPSSVGTITPSIETADVAV
jgi:hypothetical protein